MNRHQSKHKNRPFHWWLMLRDYHLLPLFFLSTLSWCPYIHVYHCLTVFLFIFWPGFVEWLWFNLWKSNNFIFVWGLFCTIRLKDKVVSNQIVKMSLVILSNWGLWPLNQVNQDPTQVKSCLETQWNIEMSYLLKDLSTPFKSRLILFP